MNEERYLKERLLNIDENLFKEITDFFGLDKCVEIYHNLVDVIHIDNIDFNIFLSFAYYDNALSEILFTLLRHQENHVKAFLCNQFNNYKVQIEARPSNYSKTKYYFKIPVGVNKYLDIRTHNYEVGPIDYYDAIKTLDFYDVNLIMFHLPRSLVDKFSSNPYILDDLDKTRQLRNYVYHHNMLFSMGKEYLEHSILLVINNLPSEDLKILYKNKIDNIKLNINDKVINKLIKVNIPL